MADWPTTIAIPERLDDTISKPLKIQTSLAGYPMSFSGATTQKRIFRLSWRLLSTEDKNTIQTFFNTYGGGEFIWSHPSETDTSYTVLFGQSDIKFSYVSIDNWRTDITFFSLGVYTDNPGEGEEALLTEDGEYLLTEDGEKILL